MRTAYLLPVGSKEMILDRPSLLWSSLMAIAQQLMIGLTGIYLLPRKSQV